MKARPARPVTVTVVHSPACHFCDDARAVLAEFATGYGIQVEWVGAGTPLGRDLVAGHRAALFPLVLVDGAFFSTGRLPRRKLRKLLDTRTAGAVA